MTIFIFVLFLLTISNSYKMYFYFYLDDSLSSLTIDNTLILSGKDEYFQPNFQKLGPYDISLGSNKKMILMLYNQNGLWGLNGYI